MEQFVYEEIDPDYEFDASRFYDFTLPETNTEAREAERWFESAESYPPSRKHFRIMSINIESRLLPRHVVDFYFLYK